MSEETDKIKSKFNELGFDNFDSLPSDGISKILEFEKANKIVLSEEYKYFLINFGEGNFEDDAIYKPVKDTPFTNSDGYQEINFFYGIGTKHDISSVTKRYANRIPQKFVPIAELPGGNQLCIDAKNEFPNNGKIYLWDHENECDGGYKNIHLVANSFSDFISSFKKEHEKNDTTSIVHSRFDF